jgi:hypothetical protein
VIQNDSAPRERPLWIIHPGQLAAAEEQLQAAGISYQIVAACAAADVADVGDVGSSVVAADGDA